jgi:hypothetical protein
MKALLNSDDYVNNTDKIRQLKHSEDILLDVGKICKLKQMHPKMKNLEEEFKHLCQTSCPFLYNHYTDIFNKVFNDELDLKLLVKFVEVLKKIENGAADQYEASVEVGTILKEMYVDSALRKAGKLNSPVEPEITYKEGKSLSWAQFKRSHK